MRICEYLYLVILSHGERGMELHAKGFSSLNVAPNDGYSREDVCSLGKASFHPPRDAHL